MQPDSFSVLKKIHRVLFICAASFVFANVVLAQNLPAPVPLKQFLKRTSSFHDIRRAGFGGSLILVGAPIGSITIEGWAQNAIEISAEIELQAETEEDLTRLAAVNSFIIDEGNYSIKILTTGTHDKTFMKRVAKDFPKKLLELPWRIDYRLRVPQNFDMEVGAGRGNVSVMGVEGLINITAVESEIKLSAGGGMLRANVAGGSVDLNVLQRTWRGTGVDISLVRGNINVTFPPGLNADVSAEVQRTGKIENSYPGLQSGAALNPRAFRMNAGAGGAYLTFRIGDGTIKFAQTKSAP